MEMEKRYNSHYLKKFETLIKILERKKKLFDIWLIELLNYHCILTGSFKLIISKRYITNLTRSFILNCRTKKLFIKC